jgi:hypothetical protein
MKFSMGIWLLGLKGALASEAYPETTRSYLDGSSSIDTDPGNFSIIAAANPEDVPHYDDNVRSTLTLVLCANCFADNAVPYVKSLDALEQPSVILGSASTLPFGGYLSTGVQSLTSGATIGTTQDALEVPWHYLLESPTVSDKSVEIYKANNQMMQISFIYFLLESLDMKPALSQSQKLESIYELLKDGIHSDQFREFMQGTFENYIKLHPNLWYQVNLNAAMYARVYQMFAAAAHDVLKTLVPTLSDIDANGGEDRLITEDDFVFDSEIKEQIMGVDSHVSLNLCNGSMPASAIAYLIPDTEESTNLFERVAKYLETMQATELSQVQPIDAGLHQLLGSLDMMFNHLFDKVHCLTMMSNVKDTVETAGHQVSHVMVDSSYAQFNSCVSLFTGNARAAETASLEMDSSTSMLTITPAF